MEQDLPGKVIRTMEEFSRFVGLSRPTVSKFFHDPESIRPKTRDRIEAAIDKTGFRPNMFAVNLNRRRANIIGVIVPNSSDPFYMALARRVELIANTEGFLAFVLSSDGDADLEARAITTLKSMNAAGAIIAPLGIKSHRDTLRSLSDATPIVYVDSPLDETSPFVGTDNRQSFQLMTDYLCRSGEPPCYLGMPAVNTNARTREAAYAESMLRLNREPMVLNVSGGADWDFERFGFDEMRRLISQKALPSRTVLCANDRIAFGAISAAYQAGVKVGQTGQGDLRIAGHDDHPLSRYACPPITTVAQDYDQIGTRALDLLFQMMDLEQEQHVTDRGEIILLKGEIVLRNSA